MFGVNFRLDRMGGYELPNKEKLEEERKQSDKAYEEIFELPKRPKDVRKARAQRGGRKRTSYAPARGIRSSSFSASMRSRSGSFAQSLQSNEPPSTPRMDNFAAALEASLIEEGEPLSY